MGLFGCCSKNDVTNEDGSMKVFDKTFKTVQLELGKVTEESHDTKVFRFNLPAGHRLGLPVGQHIQLQADIDGKNVKRSYTPITLDSAVGHVDCIIKVYMPNEKFPNGGAMSQYVNSLNVGDKINVLGPRGKIMYKGMGEFNFREEKESGDFNQVVKAKNVVMIAGGTGIAPMLQIVRDVLKDQTDNTNMALLFANQTENDILCRNELEQFSQDSRFKVSYTLDRPEEGWTGQTGFINDEMIQACLPGPSDDTIVLLCGPPPMIKFACMPNLEKLGYNMDKVFSY